MKTLYFYFSVLLGCSLAIISCKKTDFYLKNGFGKPALTHQAYGLKASYTAALLYDHTLQLSLNVRDTQNKILFNEALRIPAQDEEVGYTISTLITEKVQKIAPKTDKSVITKIAYLLDDMLQDFTNNNTTETIRQWESQGLFIMSALVKATRRQIKAGAKRYADLLMHTPFPAIYAASLGDISATSALSYSNIAPVVSKTTSQQTPFPYWTYWATHTPLSTNTTYEGFNRGLSSFILNEDIYLNVANFIRYAQTTNRTPQEKSAGAALIPVLQQFQTPVVSLQELLTAFRKYYRKDFEKAFNMAKERGEVTGEFNEEDLFKKNECKGWKRFASIVAGGWGILGTDWGCCGNYKGCCWHANPVCYTHDAMCAKCGANNPINPAIGAALCLPGCRPEGDHPPPSPTSPPIYTGGGRGNGGGGSGGFLPAEPCIQCSEICPLYSVIKTTLKALEQNIATGTTIDTDFFRDMSPEAFEHFLQLCVPVSEYNKIRTLYYYERNPINMEEELERIRKNIDL